MPTNGRSGKSIAHQLRSNTRRVPVRIAEPGSAADHVADESAAHEHATESAGASVDPSTAAERLRPFDAMALATDFLYSR
jgi:hypothetical protein